MHVSSIKSVSNNIQFKGSKIPKCKKPTPKFEDVLPHKISERLRKELDRQFKKREEMIASRIARQLQAIAENANLRIVI